MMLTIIIVISIITLLFIVYFLWKKLSHAALESEINKIKIPDDTFENSKDTKD